jgi:hemolysin III
MKIISRDQTHEWANVWTHLIGLVAAIIGFPVLWYQAYKRLGGDNPIFKNGQNYINHNLNEVKISLTENYQSITGSQYFSLWVFGIAMITVFLTSVCYHLSKHPLAKKRWKIADHSAIYLLIAGTQTPFLLIYFYEPKGMILLGILWITVVFGIIYKLFFTGRHPKFSLILYISMGSLSLIAFPHMLPLMSEFVKNCILIGGAFYLIGTIFYTWKKLPFHHAIWHLFVCGGASFHFFAIYHTYAVIS